MGYNSTAFDIFNKENISKMLFVVDPLKKPSQFIRDRLIGYQKNYDAKIRPSLVITRMDMCFNRRKLYDIISEYEGFLNFEKVFYVSSETDFGFDSVKEFIIDEAHEGVWEYDKNIICSKSEIDIIQEVIKGCIYDYYYDEIPY